MKKDLINLFLSCGLLLFCAGDLFASGTVTSSELIANSAEYNGQRVVYSGEVVGDVMARKDHAWINVHDGDNAIGVWISASLAGNIKNTGSYKSTGDKIEVTGIFNRACPEHGADLDIHAQGLRILKEGGQIKRQFDTGKRNAVVILCGVVVILWILTLLLRR